MCHERESYVLALNSKNPWPGLTGLVARHRGIRQRNYRGLAREHLVQQAGMDFRIAIGAAVFYNEVLRALNVALRGLISGKLGPKPTCT